jgi:hypothetical protein
MHVINAFSVWATLISCHPPPRQLRVPFSAGTRSQCGRMISVCSVGAFWSLWICGIEEFESPVRFRRAKIDIESDAEGQNQHREPCRGPKSHMTITVCLLTSPVPLPAIPICARSIPTLMCFKDSSETKRNMTQFTYSPSSGARTVPPRRRRRPPRLPR